MKKVLLSEYSIELDWTSIAVCIDREDAQIDHFVDEVPEQVAEWLANGDFWGAYITEDGRIAYETYDGQVVIE